MLFWISFIRSWIPVRDLGSRNLLRSYTEEFHLCFLATKRDGFYFFPLEIIHRLEPVHEGSRNKAVPPIFIAFILNSCSSIQYIAVVNDLPFQVSNLSTNNFSKMQSCLERRRYSKIS